MHLVSILEFLNYLELFLFIVKLVEDTAKNIVGALNFSVSKLNINLVGNIVVSCVATFSVSLTHLVLMILVSLLTLFSLYQLIVNILELL